VLVILQHWRYMAVQSPGLACLRFWLAVLWTNFDYFFEKRVFRFRWQSGFFCIVDVRCGSLLIVALKHFISWLLFCYYVLCTNFDYFLKEECLDFVGNPESFCIVDVHCGSLSIVALKHFISWLLFCCAMFYSRRHSVTPHARRPECR